MLNIENVSYEPYQKSAVLAALSKWNFRKLDLGFMCGSCHNVTCKIKLRTSAGIIQGVIICNKH